MADLIVQNSGINSPFDAIRHTDEQGEYWLARELMPILGYERWERFADVIERAKAACQNTGNLVRVNFFAEVRKSNGRPKEEYRLTRYASYLVAQNGDPRKPEIAAAQSYFAIKTREAEKLNGQDQQPQRRALPSAIEYVQATEKVHQLPIPASLKQLLLDKIGDELAGDRSQKLIGGKSIRLVGAAQKAEEMGYSLDASTRIHLGEFMALQGLPIVKEERLCNGQMRPINCYEDGTQLETAIAAFFR